jgi:prevent-host-death family protein
MGRAVSKSELKARALEYFRRVQQTQEELIVTERGKPVLKVVPYREAPGAALKALRGSVVSYIDPTEPVAVENWEALRRSRRPGRGR